MTSSDELKRRREKEAKRIRTSLNRQRGVQHASLKGGEPAASQKEELCIGCDQCTIVCDDDAIEMYKVAMRSPLINVEAIRKPRSFEMLVLDADSVFLLAQPMLSI